VVKLPRDPGSLTLDPATFVLPSGTLLWRLYRHGGVHGTPWNGFRTHGPVASARFDHHPPPPADHGPAGPAVLYAAESGPACVAEAFQGNRTIMRRHHQPHLVAFTVARDVPLLDLCGTWPTAAGASQAISSGPRPASRVWARAIRTAYPASEGLRYRSSMYGGEPVVVFNELARNASPPRPDDDLALDDPTITPYLDAVALEINYRVAD